MDRIDALNAFVAVLNTVRPPHPHWDDPFECYPASREQIDFGVTRSSYARCGALRPPQVAAYSTRMTYINRISRERHLAVLVHEISHIVVAPGVNGHRSTHPRAFWRNMAFHALELRDALEDGVLKPVFGEVDVAEFLEEVANDPNGSTVDRRNWSVEECRERMQELLGIKEQSETGVGGRVLRLND